MVNLRLGNETVEDKSGGKSEGGIFRPARFTLGSVSTVERPACSMDGTVGTVNEGHDETPLEGCRLTPEEVEGTVQQRPHYEGWG